MGEQMLICPLHSLKFDLVTGCSSDGSCKLVVYATRLSSTGQIVVDLGDA
jgi:nitrite reductase/ring-hydroxylating ferredoxin subunit